MAGPVSLMVPHLYLVCKETGKTGSIEIWVSTQALRAGQLRIHRQCPLGRLPFWVSCPSRTHCPKQNALLPLIFSPPRTAPSPHRPEPSI